MAIEWYISDARPVSELAIIKLTGEIAARLLRCEIDLSMSRRLAESRAANAGGFFNSQVYGEGPEFSALVDINSQPSADEEGKGFDESTVFGAVSSRRTQCSVVLGIATAISWTSCANGDLSGTGLKRYFSSADINELAESLSAPNGMALEVAVGHVSRLTLGPDARLPYR
jgi:hypothetical protein